MEITKHILIADDNALALESMACALQSAGYCVGVAQGANECLEFVRTKDLHLIVLDSTLQAASGFAVCRLLRETTQLPILFLLDSPGKIDCTFAIQLGASHCLVKPFSLRELVVQVKAIIGASLTTSAARIEAKERETHIEAGDLTIYPQRYEIAVQGKHVQLSVIQMRIMLALMEHKGRFVTTQTLGYLAWGETQISQTKVTTLVRKLREKIEPDPSHPRYVLSTKGAGGGYKLGA